MINFNNRGRGFPAASRSGLVWLWAFHLMLSTPVSGQQETNEWTQHRTSWRTANDSLTPSDVMRNARAWLPPEASLQPLARRISPLGRHLRYQIGWRGIPLYRAQLQLRREPGGRIRMRAYLPRNLNKLPPPAPYPVQAIPDTMVLALDTVMLDSISYRKYWYANPHRMLPALALTWSGHEHEELLVNLEGEILARQALVRRHGPKRDTSLQLEIFFPDPVTSAMTTYGAPYADLNDVTNTQLDAERFLKTIDGRYRNDSFFLENEAVRITDFLAPQDTLFWQPQASFRFNRSQAPFEAANVYFHLTRQYRWLQSLDYTQLLGYQLPVDPRGGRGDNSFFRSESASSDRGRLEFGIGGVDDGEDADVVVHELTHALANHLSPGTFTGYERRALEEGIADYFAASYSRAISEYRWADLYTWDGHNEFWPGRTAVNSRRYPEDLNGRNNIWLDGGLWSAAMMQLWERIGRHETDRLMTAVMYELFPEMKIGDALTLLHETDSILNGWQHRQAIDASFAAYGFENYLKGPVSSDSPTKNTRSSNAENPFYLDTSPEWAAGKFRILVRDTHFIGQPLVVELYSTNGKNLGRKSITIEKQQTVDMKPYLPAGVYLLRLRASSHTQTIKILR